MLAVTGSGLVVSVAFASATYSIARANLLDQRRHAVLRQAYVDANFLRGQLVTGGVTAADALAALSPEGATAVLIERDGRWSSSLLDVGLTSVPLELRDRAADGQVAYTSTRSPAGPALAVAVPVPAVRAVVYEVAPLTELATTLRVLSTVLTIGAVAGTAFAVALGLWARRRLLQPLTPIAATAAAVAAGDLTRRLPSTTDPDLVTLVGSFNTMVDALHQRIERDARFAADVAHELRSPLTTLVASVDLLSARAEQMTRRDRTVLALVTAELDRFRSLLEGLLELARSDAEEVSARPVDLVDVVRHALQRAGGREHLLDLEQEHAWVTGDKLRLERAVANLLDNADRHGGGVTSVAVQVRDALVRVVVDDAGPGVPAASQERVFERFATGGGPRGSASGTGLGLALVAETVRAHGGATWCTDRPGGGARFILQLPEGTAHQDDTPGTSSSPTPTAGLSGGLGTSITGGTP